MTKTQPQPAMANQANQANRTMTDGRVAVEAASRKRIEQDEVAEEARLMVLCWVLLSVRRRHACMAPGAERGRSAANAVNLRHGGIEDGMHVCSMSNNLGDGLDHERPRGRVVD
jgi:hypothetical protein